jgi:hypothetical protein
MLVPSLVHPIVIETLELSAAADPSASSRTPAATRASNSVMSIPFAVHSRHAANDRVQDTLNPVGRVCQGTSTVITSATTARATWLRRRRSGATVLSARLTDAAALRRPSPRWAICRWVHREVSRRVLIPPLCGGLGLASARSPILAGVRCLERKRARPQQLAAVSLRSGPVAQSRDVAGLVTGWQRINPRQPTCQRNGTHSPVSHAASAVAARMNRWR